MYLNNFKAVLKSKLLLALSAVIFTACIKKEENPVCGKVDIFFINSTNAPLDTVKLILNQGVDTSVSKLELQVYKPDTTRIVWLQDTMGTGKLYLGLGLLSGDRIILRDVPTEGRDFIQIIRACRLETPTGQNAGCFGYENLLITSCDNLIVEAK